MSQSRPGPRLTFRCSSETCRQRRGHTQERTGRSRRVQATRHGLSAAHEYTCTCGHVGWSKHADVLRLPLVVSQERHPTADPDCVYCGGSGTAPDSSTCGCYGYAPGRARNVRRCCEPGCPAECPTGGKLLAGWYAVQHGRGNRACPDHAAAWRDLDVARTAWSMPMITARHEAIVLFRERWTAEYEAANPMPSRPSQPSRLPVGVDDGG